MARTKQWPTPQARDTRTGDPLTSPRVARKQEQGWSPNLNDMVLWPTPRAEKIDGMASEGYSPTLHQTVQQWPTPKGSNANGAGLQTMVTLWPTPAARDWKNGQASDATRHRNARPLCEWVIQSNETKQEPAYLNAEFVECLMGFPQGWSVPAGPPGQAKRRQPGSRRGRSRVE